MEKNLDELAIKLINTFFYNRHVYAIQEKNDNKFFYITNYKKIDPPTLKYILKTKGSVVSYQQNIEKLQWICLDFDIKSECLENNYNFFSDDYYRKLLLADLEITIDFLNDKKIHYLVEFSGNRGFHIWILFDQEISKKLGFAIIESIVNSLKLKNCNNIDDPLTIDKFPKTSSSKGNKIGLGVKIPLSFHLKSDRYSYLVENIFDIQPINELTEEFLSCQLELLNKVKKNNVKDIIIKLNISSLEEFNIYDRDIGYLHRNKPLDTVIDELSKCEIYQQLFQKPISTLNEVERKIITATLIRLSCIDDTNFGKKLLLDFFSRDELNFNKEITEKKLNLFTNLYPPSIAFLEKTFHTTSQFCYENDIKHVLQLLSDVEVVKKDEISNLVQWIINSEKKYLTQNDEVSLNFIYDDLSELSQSFVINELNNIKLGKPDNSLITYYKYKREEGNKERILYSLSAITRVLSSTVMFAIDDFIYGQHQYSNSYSYKLNRSGYTNDLFVSWNSLWLNFAKDIDDKLSDPAYESYYILKVDLTKYYDSINLTFLREKLFKNPSPEMSLVLDNLDETRRSEYKNLCEYLINICTYINDTGVPQGPAFARYLAEIYLSEIDSYIKDSINEMEHFYRYVDDFVIFLQSKEKAQELKESLELRFKQMDLNLNIEKTYIKKVKEAKKDLILLDHSKYFIDGIDKNRTTHKAKEKAILLLNNMVENFDEHIKDFPFFLTHLIDSTFVKHKKSQIIQKVTASSIGRGSMFKHFYKNLVFKFNCELSFYRNIEGLSRSNFINELSRDENAINYSEEIITEIIHFYLSNELYDYEMIELIRLLIKNNIDIEKSQAEKLDIDILLNVILKTKKLHIPSNILAIILPKLQKITDVNKTLYILEHILENSNKISNIKILNDTIYAVIKENQNKIINLQCLYDLTAYLTICIDNFSNIKLLWEILTNIITESDFKDLKFQSWYKFRNIISNYPLSHKSIIQFITLTYQGTGLNNKKGPHKLEENYSNYLLLYLCANGEESIRTQLTSLDIRPFIEENNMKFLSWCLDGDQVKYFPNKDLALLNIEYNDRLILQKDNQLLVRGKKEIFCNANDLEREANNNLGISYFKIFEINHILESFSDKINKLNYIEALRFLVNTYTLLQKNGFMLNIFEKGAFCDFHNDFLFKFSKNDKLFIIDSETYVSPQNIEAFTKSMITALCQSNEKLNFYELYSERLSELQITVIPNIKSSLKTISFLSILVDYIEQKNISMTNTNPFKFEECKLLSIAKYASIEKSFSDYSKEIRFLPYYLNLYNSDIKFGNDRYLLFSKVDLKLSNLSEAIDTLKNSCSNFISFSLIEKLFMRIKKNIDDNLSHLVLTDCVNVELESSYNDDDSILINKFKYELNELSFFEFFKDRVVSQISYDQLLKIKNYSNVYFCQNIIIVFPQVIEKVYEIIEYKPNELKLPDSNLELSIRNDYYFSSAVKNIMIQNDITLIESEKKLIGFLRDYDTCFTSIIKIISSFKAITDEDNIFFIKQLKYYLDDENSTLIALKDIENDKNGLYKLLYDKNKDIFDRNLKYHKLLLLNLDNFRRKKISKHLVIISDLGLSGNQFKTSISKYLSSNSKTEKKGFHSFKSGVFKNNLESIEEITCLNCLYTEHFKVEITEYLNSVGFHGRINFEGTFIDNNYQFSNLDAKDKSSFISLVKGSNYLSKLPMPVKFDNYYEYIDQIELDTPSNMMVLRYKSLPKLHHAIFTEKIFKYRKDI